MDVCGMMHTFATVIYYMRHAMAEQLILTAGDKAARYEEILPQIYAVIEGETDLVANLANVSAILKECFEFFWVGFYLVKGAEEQKELVLGPFQGPLACTRIHKGRGVCGTSWQQKHTVIVADVEQFPGHIACSSLSKSEIVVPVLRDGEVMAVLDVDSVELGMFDMTDRHYLEQLAEHLSIIWQ